MKIAKRIASVASAAVLAFSSFSAQIVRKPQGNLTALAAEETYPVQKFRLGIGDTNRNVNISNGSQLNSQLLNGTDNEKWSLNYVSENVYEIVNSATGYIITNNNGNCVLSPDTDAANQRWNITAVEQDFEGYDLYYKITSNENNSLAMTFQPEGNYVYTSSYSSNIYQKFKLNLDGLEGYAANASIGGKEKACTIGGLLGETVFVDTTEELVAAMKETVPLTIVITGDCDFAKQSKENQKIEDDKTILGSYANNTVYDTQWRNDDFYGDISNPPSNNIVIQNVNLVARTLTGGCGVILIYIYCGRNIWIDHCDFSATFAHNRDVEVGKFLWINTPSAGWSDGCYNGINPDYITVSYNHFNNRFWTVAYGSQNSDASRVRTSLMYNYWQQCARRTPQIGNGTGHIYNNFYTFSGSGASSQIIGGDGSNILSENCRFEGVSGLEIEGGGSTSSPYTDSGSYTASNSSSTPTALNYNPKYASSLKPSDSYGYSLIDAYNTNGTDTKNFCQTYTGCFKNSGGIKFITDSDMSSWVSMKYDTPFLKNITVSDAKPGAVMNTNVTYVFENVNSGLYLEVAGGEAASGANVQQGSTGSNGWKLVDAGEGYYYIYSEVGDGQSYCLDLNFGETDNGTNIGIWTNDESDARKFKFIENSDGTYSIVTKCTNDASGIGVVSASTDDGANVIQWKCNDSADQKWNANIRMNGELISEVLVDNAAYLDGWSVNKSIAVGDLVFADRDATYTVIPPELDGAEALIVDCDAKNVTSDIAVLKADTDITLYVGLDARVTTIPSWLSGWTDIELTVSNSKDVIFNLYKLDVKAGENITLGTNGQTSGCVNYTVFAVAPVEATLWGDANVSGKVDVADVVAVRRYLVNAEKYPLTETAMLNADVQNNGGGINAQDAVAIQKFVLGMVTSLPIE